MKLTQEHIDYCNQDQLQNHRRLFAVAESQIAAAERVVNDLRKFNIAIPSWALSTGGTRFGRFPGAGEPVTLEQKISDVAILDALNKSSGSISIHLPWDMPDDISGIKQYADAHGIRFDAVNSNTFQDQAGQVLSYKFGSLQHNSKEVRSQAIAHNLSVVEVGKKLGTNALSLWLADGSNYPGQLNFRRAFENTYESLHEIYRQLPEDWRLYIEYKCFEPGFYSTTIADWGQALLYANKLGERAGVLVDLGHHLPSANIEQIVSLLLMEGKLSGFHFNDSKYADDDLTVGCINPYQLFLIFNELVQGPNVSRSDHSTALAWMIDASHNLKDPLEDLLQSVEAILIAYAQALIIDQQALTDAQQNNDAVRAQEILQDAFRTDVRPLIREAALRNGAAIHPLDAYRKLNVRGHLVQERG